MSIGDVFDTTIRINGRKELVIENSMGICEFGNNTVTLKTKDGVLEVRGNKLIILNADDAEIALSGEIISLTFL